MKSKIHFYIVKFKINCTENPSYEGHYSFLDDDILLENILNMTKTSLNNKGIRVLDVFPDSELGNVLSSWYLITNSDITETENILKSISYIKYTSLIEI